jgi:hypothetical protein
MLENTAGKTRDAKAPSSDCPHKLVPGVDIACMNYPTKSFQNLPRIYKSLEIELR